MRCVIIGAALLLGACGIEADIENDEVPGNSSISSIGSIGLSVQRDLDPPEGVTEALFPPLDRFHELYNAQAYDELIAESDALFTEDADPEYIDGFLDTLQEKLGTFQSAELTAWRRQITSKGDLVIGQFAAQYAQAEGILTVTVNITDDQPRVAGYYVDSPALFDL